MPSYEVRPSKIYDTNPKVLKVPAQTNETTQFQSKPNNPNPIGTTEKDLTYQSKFLMQCTKNQKAKSRIRNPNTSKYQYTKYPKPELSLTIPTTYADLSSKAFRLSPMCWNSQPESLQQAQDISRVSTIQLVVLTDDVFHLKKLNLR